jgi:hypothetical protein
MHKGLSAYNFYTVNLFLLVLLYSCTNIRETEHHLIKGSAEPEEVVLYDTIEHKGNEAIGIKVNRIDTLAAQDSQGIVLSLGINLNPGIFDSLKKLGYSCLYFNLSCITDNNINYSSMHDIKRDLRIHTNKERFFSASGIRNIEYKFPYRNLEMPEGIHQVHILIEALPVNFIKDTSSSDFRFIDRISTIPLTLLKLKLKVHAPRLLKASVEVYEFKLDTKKTDPQKFDFSLGGSGYPDLYWSLYCGEELVYYSPQERNATLYKRKFCTKPFYCSSEDIIRINIADYDNGPFNTEDDIVDTWTGKISELVSKKPDTLTFGRLQYLILHARIMDQ